MWNFFSVFFPLFVFLLLHQEAGWWIISENLWRSFQTVPQDQVWRNDSRQHLHAGMKKIRYYPVTNFSLRGGSRGDVQGMHPLPLSYLWISYITSTVEKKEKKTSVIYWCWSKTRDKVKEFELNAAKLVIWHGSFEY